MDMMKVSHNVKLNCDVQCALTYLHHTQMYVNCRVMSL